MLRRLAEEPGSNSPGEEITPGLLRIDQLPVAGGRPLEVVVGVLDDVDLPPGPIEVPGEGQELEEEQPPRLVQRTGLYLEELGLDGLAQPPCFVQLTGIHGLLPNPEKDGLTRSVGPTLLAMITARDKYTLS